MEKSCYNFHMCKKKKKIATNLPSDLLLEAVQLSGLNQTAAIIEGLKELVKREKLNQLVQLEGKLDISYDIDVLRKRQSL